MDVKGLGMPPFIRKWEKELGTQMNDSEIGKIMRMAHTTSIDYNTIEMSYKCLTRWYITPGMAHNYQWKVSQLCWRGCKELGTMSHIWWTCPKIKKYWREVLQIIKNITIIEILEDLWGCLFHGIQMPTKRYMRSLVPHLLNASKSLIPKQWQELESPTMRSWFNKVNDIYNLEYLRFSGEEGWEGFEEKWRDWVNFKQTLSFAENMGT